MSSISEQPAREANVNAIVSYFESGIKQQPGSIGIELEQFITRKDLSPVTYSDNPGVEEVLSALGADYPEEVRDAEGDLLGLSRPGENITLEPSAQLELSAGPFSSLCKAQETFEGFEALLSEVLSKYGFIAVAQGYRPKAKANDLPRIPKQRYDFMDRYFKKIGTYGAEMMRCSAATQVSIDYFSVSDCLEKLKIAFALTPILALITDNSPSFQGAKRPHPLMRTEIWRYCDPDRCGLVTGVLDNTFTLSDYAAYILDTPAILVPDGDGWLYTEQTFGTIYADSPMSKSDVEHALSMFFNDARLKTYIEIRPADSMPIPYVLSYAALINGLFYHEPNLRYLSSQFEGLTPRDVDDAKTALMEAGYNTRIYGQTPGAIADLLLELASQGLSEGEQDFLTPLHDLITHRTTLAEIALKTGTAI